LLSRPTNQQDAENGEQGGREAPMESLYDFAEQCVNVQVERVELVNAKVNPGVARERIMPVVFAFFASV
jgi:hypothetical protein